MANTGSGVEDRAVALVGCGHIAQVHLQVLRALGRVRAVALCDPSRARAEALARSFGIGEVYGSLAELLAAGSAGTVHVLTPPETHFEVARQCLVADRHVLVEKPLCLQAAQAAELGELAQGRGRTLGVNHNLVLHPAVQRLQRWLAKGQLGVVEHLEVVHHAPLRQLVAADFGHFMFGSDAAILWEQGVHLFSLVHRLLGPAVQVTAQSGEPLELPHGVTFRCQWDVQLRCTGGSATVRMAFGRSMPVSRLHVLCSDGVADVDLLAGTCAVRRKTRWLDFLDAARNELGRGLHHLGAAWKGTAGYGLGLFGLTRPSDSAWRSMHKSISGFHRAVAGGSAPPCTAADGAAVLAMCERTAVAAGAPATPPERPALPPPVAARPGEVLVLGGTGLIGRRVVAQLRAAGRPVSLLVRRPWLLPSDLCDGSVRVFRGDAADPHALELACGGVARVLHLATCAGDDPRRVAESMAAAVGAAATACRQAAVHRLVYASSTAAMWLGSRGPVPGDAPPDPMPERRAPYARAKIAAEHELARHRGQGLDVVIVRPAIVVGGGAPPQHGGLGLWVRDNHCVGWGRGRNPLPLVLVEDCARGLIAALDAEAAAGKTYALAGAVRPAARQYIAELRARTGRAFHYHPQTVTWTMCQELGKHLVKFLARRPRELPSRRDLRSRGFFARLDCTAAERDLGFHPEADREVFLTALFGPARGSP